MEPMDAGELRLEGRTLAGRYLLETEVASGGMGTVWRARDEVLGRPVAVKVLHDRLAGDPDVLERFRLEAVAAARLSHHNVVRVFDTGIDDGVCYIVMELFEGTTLESLLGDQGSLPGHEAARVMGAVLQGLAHAHREGVVHRDVKPANVLIDRSGLVKVTDFGIAKAAFAGEDLTATGDLLGTVRYLAPEQVAGGNVDGRADLYACGVVLYESLTGRAPFEGPTHIATATMRLTKEPPPPGALRPGIPRGLETVTMRALAMDRAQRYQSADEMRADLDRAAPPAGIRRTAPVADPRPERTSAFRSWMAIPLILLLVAALAVGGFTLLAPLFEGENGGNDQSPAESANPPRPLNIAGGASFDPFGTGGEHDEDVPAAYDGDPSTAWQTEGYNSPDLDKPGVGISFDLGQERAVGGVRLRTDSPGFTFSVFTADAPESFDPEGGTPLASAEGDQTFTAEDGIDLAFDPVRARYVLIWITHLVEHDGYRALVNEAEILAPGG
jgi:eukaryotic-like serine/threonine-protein kinase